MGLTRIEYADLPEVVKNNLTADQFDLARVDIIQPGEEIPETTEYIDLASGIRRVHRRGDVAAGNLLPTHDLSGAHGKEYTQWQDFWPRHE